MSQPPAKPSSASQATTATPSHSQRAQRSDHHAAAATAATPPPQRRNERHPVQQIRAHLARPVDLAHCDIPVVLCCLASGLCDASAFAAWGCFVSMQTGGWLERSRGGIAAALWISAGVKLGITVSWLFWKAEKTGDG